MAAQKSGHDRKFDIVIVGGGLAGLTAALALSKVCEPMGKSVAIVAPAATAADMRTTAMMMPTIGMMEKIGAWGELQEHTAPLKTMRLVDGSERLVRSPVIDFKSSELDLEAFGYNVPNALMAKRLLTQIKNDKTLTHFDTKLESADCREDGVALKLVGGEQLEAELVVAADGRHSAMRDAAGIAAKEWSYPQSAVVLTFGHTLPHNGISTELHTETGPFTQVPLPASNEWKYRSSLVWVQHPSQIEETLSLSNEELSEKIEAKLQSCFGRVEIDSQPKAFPLSGMTAKTFAANRVVLIGEAGHVFPPIGAQGFNLGARDLQELVDLIEKHGEDIGAPSFTDAYNRNRTADVHLRTIGVDLLNRSLLTSFLPVQLTRVLGVSSLKNISWLRKIAMQQGLGAGSDSSSRRPRLPNPFSLLERGRAAAGR